MYENNMTSIYIFNQKHIIRTESCFSFASQNSVYTLNNLTSKPLGING